MNRVPFILSFDMRAPAFGAPTSHLYAAVLEMVAYADSHGIPYATVMEHHGSEDGYLPTPFLLATAMAARTKKMRFVLGAVILPLHDPVAVAEQIAVADIISEGRVDVVFGAGYVESEFQMFRASLRDRARLMDEGIPIIQRALSGERFSAGGREIFIRPLPIQQPYPPLYVGGGVAASALRAARCGIGLRPLNLDIVPLYEAECAKLGHKPFVSFHQGWVHVSEDPDKSWHDLAPHLAHVVKSYAGWAKGTTSSSPFEKLASVSDLKATGILRVVTPDECVKLANELPFGELGLATVLGGLDPKIGWSSLELVVNKVMPRLKK